MVIVRSLIAAALTLAALALPAAVPLAAGSGVLPSAPFAQASPAPGDTTGLDDHQAETSAEAEARFAQQALRQLQATHRYLDGVTVRIAATPGGKQAVAYYTEGEIVIDPAHSVELSTILDHEIWHVIDWRDNGRLDWGESVPPRNAADYLIER